MSPEKGEVFLQIVTRESRSHNTMIRYLLEPTHESQASTVNNDVASCMKKTNP